VVLADHEVHIIGGCTILSMRFLAGPAKPIWVISPQAGVL
jgi:hypothetical protein